MPIPEGTWFPWFPPRKNFTRPSEKKGCAFLFSQASFNKAELCIFFTMIWSKRATKNICKTCPSFFLFWSCWWWTFEKTAFIWGCICPKSDVFGSIYIYIWVHRWFKTATWEPLKEYVYIYIYVYSEWQVPIFNVPDVHHLLRLEEGKL